MEAIGTKEEFNTFSREINFYVPKSDSCLIPLTNLTFSPLLQRGRPFHMIVLPTLYREQSSRLWGIGISYRVVEKVKVDVYIGLSSLRI